MRTVHFIHGFNERHRFGNPRIAAVAKQLNDIADENIGIMIHDYGRWDLVATRNNENIARLIASTVNDGDILVGFSNGCAVIARICKIIDKPDALVFIQPALKKGWRAPKFIKRVVVFWNPYDVVTVAGKWWRRAANLLPWNWKKDKQHLWGEMGHKGYTGKDDRYIQYNTVNTKLSNGTIMPKAKGHDGWRKSKEWIDFIASEINDYANRSEEMSCKKNKRKKNNEKKKGRM